ncbi:hypothetical protein PUN28_008523 [Cardiocondyla obscurior]|uniref:Uncharacterized protein n=1 Tax=Cardiocondyla obscurior TaxID=286306 RepID=A0AAW2FZQ7_9HYME
MASRVFAGAVIIQDAITPALRRGVKTAQISQDGQSSIRRCSHYTGRDHVSTACASRTPLSCRRLRDCDGPALRRGVKTAQIIQDGQSSSRRCSHHTERDRKRKRGCCYSLKTEHGLEKLVWAKVTPSFIGNSSDDVKLLAACFVSSACLLPDWRDVSHVRTCCLLDRSEGQVVAGEGEREREITQLLLAPTRHLSLAARCPFPALRCGPLPVSHRCCMLDRSEGQVVAGEGEKSRSYCSLPLVCCSLLAAHSPLPAAVFCLSLTVAACSTVAKDSCCMLDRSEGQVVAGKGERPRSYCSLQLVTRRLLLATRCPLACPVLVVSHRLPESRDPHVATCSQSQNVTGRRRRKQHPRRTERRRRSRKGIGLQRGNVDVSTIYHLNIILSSKLYGCKTPLPRIGSIDAASERRSRPGGHQASAEQLLITGFNNSAVAQQIGY